MPANRNGDDTDSGLPPPGRRWGAGAQSVLPYLTKSLQSKPASASEANANHAGDARAREHASATARAAAGGRR